MRFASQRLTSAIGSRIESETTASLALDNKSLRVLKVDPRAVKEKLEAVKCRRNDTGRALSKKQ
jgi:ribosome biogenesis protein Nip4